MLKRHSLLKVLFLLIAYFLIANSAFAITANNYLTTADPLANSSCQMPAAKTAFSPSDAVVYLWVSLSNAAIGDTVEWRWFSPDNALYNSTPYTIATFTGTGCTWAGIYISGQQAANLPGNWKVQLYLNGTLASTTAFTIGTPPAPTGKGSVFLQFNSDNYVPGSFLDIKYRTTKGTLQGNVDIYLVVVVPSGQLLVISGNGTPVGPLLSNVTIADGTTPVLSLPFPVDLPFGTYTFYMLLAYAGSDATDSRNWASPLSQTTISYAPLSPAQRSMIQSKGKPDFIAVTWVAEVSEKRESWLYLSGSPTSFLFLNGNLESQSPISGATGGAGPKVDPNLFTPQTTLSQLTTAFGPPASVQALDIAPEYQILSYSFGLNVVLKNGRLSSAVSSTP